MKLQRVTHNVKAIHREETMAGIEYLVVPMVMMVEGVHNGSGGPIYYSADELKDAVPSWNHKPILLDHPTLGTSGCNPEVLNKQKLGVVLNTKYDNKQRAEAWFEKARLEAVAPDVYSNILNNSMMEVSTGLFIDEAGDGGVWNEEPFEKEAKNHKPDHLAVLSSGVGACSNADGAGLLVANKARDKESQEARKAFQKVLCNELSHNNIWSQINSWLRDKYLPMGEEYWWGGWLEDVYDSFFIYSYDGKLWKREYTASDNKVTIGDDSPVEVKRVTEYRTVEGGSFVGNSAKTFSGENDMDKKQKVDALIANKATKWEEKDRERLMKLDDEIIDNMVPVEVVPEPKPTENKDEKKPPEEKKPTENANPPAPVALTKDQWMAAAPSEIRSAVQNAINIETAQKEQLVGQIVANANNKFNPDWLKTQDLPYLQNLAALAGVAQQQQSSGPPMYLGANVGLPTMNAGNDEDPLELPVMNFAESQKS